MMVRAVAPTLTWPNWPVPMTVMRLTTPVNRSHSVSGSSHPSSSIKSGITVSPITRASAVKVTSIGTLIANGAGTADVMDATFGLADRRPVSRPATVPEFIRRIDSVTGTPAQSVPRSTVSRTLPRKVAVNVRRCASIEMATRVAARAGSTSLFISVSTAFCVPI